MPFPFLAVGASLLPSLLPMLSGGGGGLTGIAGGALKFGQAASPLLGALFRQRGVRAGHQQRYNAWVAGCARYGIGSSVCTEQQVARQMSLAGTLRGSPTYGAGFAQLQRLVGGGGGGGAGYRLRL